MFTPLLSVGFQTKILEEMAFSLFLSRNKEAWRRPELLLAPCISPALLWVVQQLNHAPRAAGLSEQLTAWQRAGREWWNPNTAGWAACGLGEQRQAGGSRSHFRLILLPLSHFSNGQKK